MTAIEDRNRMVDLQLAGRGITDSRLLAAFRAVPRELFVPDNLREFAYNDTPLPIDEQQTISQPYIVALTVAALNLRGGERVLEVRTGSGYAAAILGKVAKEVHSVERLETLAARATERLSRLGYDNVHVHHGDGTLGWPENTPYDAIAVAAGGPEVPKALLSQLAPKGRLVIPVGPDDASQVLTLVVREGTKFRYEELMAVQFVPLIGEQGWSSGDQVIKKPSKSAGNSALSKLIRETARPFQDIGSARVDELLERMGDARVVLLGEATHGTSEFYSMRARITLALIERRGFDFVTVEADWPDAARIDDYVLGDPPRSKHQFTPFARFPRWMWRNREVDEFVARLRARNLEARDRRNRVGFHGLDLYSMFTSIGTVLSYLDEVDPAAARVARTRYATLTPWQKDPAAYGRAVLAGRYESSERAVVAILKGLLSRRLEYAARDGERFFDAAQNARVVANAERYYRALYYGTATSWNLRDTHMFDTLEGLLAYYGPDSRGIVWEHNSHIGNALATDMSRRGELNIGQLCSARFGHRAYAVGFGTDRGTVAAASDWDEPMQRMRVRPAHRDSYERIFHDSGLPAFMLHLRAPARAALREELEPSRLERAIGVVYRPDTELASHYFSASLPRQFDEFLWFDETRAVEPLVDVSEPSLDLPDTYPFGV